MQDSKPDVAFPAADALAFIATQPVAAPAMPAASTRNVAQPSENAYAEADKASYRHLETAAYYRALDAARSAKSGERLAGMAAAVHQLADEVWANVRGDVEAAGQRPPDVEAAGKRPQIACAAGCGACCSQQVAIAPVEAAAIAQYVTRHFTDEEDAALVARLRALDALTRGKTAIERAHLRQSCAFLVENRCSIYAVRPLRCRGVHSRDAGYCGWAAAHPDEAAAERQARGGAGPYVVAPAKIMDAALSGLARACRTLGIDAESLELTAASRIALAVPGLEEFLAAGEPAFAAAALPGTAIEVAAAMPAAEAGAAD